MENWATDLNKINMSRNKNWANDINAMHHKFGVKEWFEANKGNKELMGKYLTFRLNMCLEELLETANAADLDLGINEDGKFAFMGDASKTDPEEIVDGLIDLSVFAVGTLDVFNVDANKAWDNVYAANMNKSTGVKPGRPNPFGLPDLIKPSDWVAPSHKGNHGDF
jgi:predicted HAD superfamily Cof-like phosphohydrolase